MKKIFTLIIFVILLFVSSGLISKVNARKSFPAFAAADSTSPVTLSETELFIPCRIGYVPTESCPDKTFINVGVLGAKRPDGGENEIKYKVSGGRVIGEGSQVKWDFSEVRKAGNYTITVEFMNVGKGKQIKTETITLRNCDCPNDNLPEENLADLPEIEKLELNKKEVLLACLVEEIGKENMRVKVETTVRNPKNLPLIYQYTISGGRIVGQGNTVFWDLKGVRPGTYTITVAIDYGRGFTAKTKSETVQVKECEIYSPCVCPTVEVFGGGNIKAGENVTFSVEVSGGSDTSNPTYKWTISQGEIIAGQGTREITVKTTKEMSGIIEATVEFSAPGLCQMCAVLTASETATIIK